MIFITFVTGFLFYLILYKGFVVNFLLILGYSVFLVVIGSLLIKKLKKEITGKEPVVRLIENLTLTFLLLSFSYNPTFKEINKYYYLVPQVALFGSIFWFFIDKKLYQLESKKQK